MAAPVIEARDLTKHYGGAVGLEGLDLTVDRGEVFGFLGPNGAGKTTAIRLLLDLIRPTRGEVRLFGLPARDPAARERVGYLPGDLALDGRLTGRRMILFLDALAPRRGPPPAGRLEELCDRLGLTRDDLDRPVRDDSRGTRQKIGLASAMLRRPDLLVLDEPTTGLDPLVRESVFDLLREAGREGRTVFHSSHVISEVDRTCTRAGFVRDGRLVALHRIDDLRRASVRRMVVRFDGPAPADALRLPGVEVVSLAGDQAVLRVTGTIRPLLAALAGLPVRDLVFPEQDLSDAFARYYRPAEAP